MFTGIIRHVGTVTGVRPNAGGRRLRIDLGPLAAGLGEGDSVAVSGACLTAAAVEAPSAEFDAVAETLGRTTLGRLRTGAKVNLERPVRAGEALDGHLVQGHIDGIAEVRRVRRGGEWLVEFAAPGELTDLMVPKGSAAIDGVSLTLVDVGAAGFSVVLIPTTLAETTLGSLRPGTKVNVETDVIGKYVRKHLGRSSASPGGVTLDKLRSAGFA